jgi:shikimate kinase
MSNAGKSYRSKVLSREKDFFWYHVDEEIQNALGFDDMAEISDWLGFPDSETYTGRAEEYLRLENKFTKIEHLDTHGKNLVFDTTGSVIYLRRDVKDWLYENCLVVNLNVGIDAIPDMFKKFSENPKPLMWGDYFRQDDDESMDDALKRSYPELLKDRLEKYKEMANLIIPANELMDTSAEETLRIIRSYL